MAQPGMKSHEAIAKAIDQHGAKHVAGELGVSLSLVYKWAESPGTSGAHNPLDRVEQLCRATSSSVPIQWLCEQAGGYFVVNPAVDNAAPPDVIAATRTLLKEFSDVLQEVSSAAVDGRVSDVEAVKIRSEWEELKRVAESLVSGLEKHAPREGRR
jgi:hypothetical protein